MLVARKNPFLFCVKAPESASRLAESLIDAFISSSEETKFGDIIEDIAIAICQTAKGGSKSSATGIDLEYGSGRGRTIAQIKSGTNWGNSSQHKKLESDFKVASRVLRQGSSIKNVRAVEGICYGPSKTIDKGSYYRIVGRDFWKDISGWEDAGTAVLHVIRKHAGNGLKGAREKARLRMVNYLELAGISEPNGNIHWDRMLDIAMMPARDRPKDRPEAEPNDEKQ